MGADRQLSARAHRRAGQVSAAQAKGCNLLIIMLLAVSISFLFTDSAFPARWPLYNTIHIMAQSGAELCVEFLKFFAGMS